MLTHDLARRTDRRGRHLCVLHKSPSRPDKPLLNAYAVPKKPHIPVDRQQPYIMRIADLLSDDPILTQVIGTRFKVLAECDRERKRVTYSFRHPDDFDGDAEGANSV